MDNAMLDIDMFSGEVQKPKDDLKIIPVSVIDIAAQKKRKNENHANTSSRANYSPFPSEIADLCYEFYLRDAERVFDPFAGWGERHSKAIEWGKAYTGVDISPVAITSALNDYGVDNILADALDYDIQEFDGLITCPPYWNLEKYDEDLNLSRVKTWERFLMGLNQAFDACYSAAEQGATFCVMVGDWRKDHKYYDLEYEVSGMFKGYGASIVDKVVVSRKKVSKIKIMLPQAKRLGYSVRVHESLLVFRKA
jgi:DNA modification methylase